MGDEGARRFPFRFSAWLLPLFWIVGLSIRLRRLALGLEDPDSFLGALGASRVA